ncbi:MAG: hypothetical protein GY903_06830 [Fuerstiella sp.]|nr:hypothetical protein [Fuerstiella sp.]MCP4854190.1 hypothetical protein [Fuerstiella sp.]
MTHSADFQEITILIPGYSIEDLPSDLNERNAASLLNAFSVAWHPWLLRRSARIPEFRQAESTELPTGQHIVFVPECSEDWLGHDWQEKLSHTLSVVLHGCGDRDEWIRSIDAEFGVDAEAIPESLLADFFALGTTHLQVLLLSRRMHHFVDPDGYLLESEAFAAAEAAIAGNEALARDHLRRCFECLLDCREQFYPVDCFLLDMCLPSDQTTAADLQGLIAGSPSLSLVCSGQELRKYCEAEPDFAATLKSALESDRLSLMTGHQNELRVSLGGLNAVYSDIHAAQNWVQDQLTDKAVHWARRRFGMTSSLPSLLSLFNFGGALHVVLDDGLYPDREFGQLNWQAPDGSSIDSVSRIPLAIDGASSFLRFADRFTESMQEDTTAVMLLARLPTLQSPWLTDLQIAAGYAPVLGRFVTMTDFIDQTGNQACATEFDEGEYLSPYLIQASVLKTEAPITSPAELHQQRTGLETAAFVRALTGILKPKSVALESMGELEARLGDEESRRIDLASSEPDTRAEQSERLGDIRDNISRLQTEAACQLASLVPTMDVAAKGILLINPLPWKRRTSIPWPGDNQPPAANECLTAFWHQDQERILNLELPAGGFAWIHESSEPKQAITPSKVKGKPLAEDLLLRNEYFEVELSEATGGISAVHFHNQRSNRVSQQVAFRYDSSKTYTIDDDEVTTAYAAVRLVSSRILMSGPFRGAIENTCENIDVVTQEVMARFRQTVTVERNAPRVHMQIDFDDVQTLPHGNPWMTYYACRFAWDNSAASITRSMLGQASGFRMERFEAPDYVEIADADQRLLIVPHGRPYHRRSGPRMLDSLLLVEGESARRFEVTLEFDQAYPMRTAQEILLPPVPLVTESRIPKGTASAWILGLSSKNVIVARTRCECLNDQSAVPEMTDDPAASSSASLTLLLQETEGRSANCLIRTARPPASARQRRPDGTTIQELRVSEKGVHVEFSRFQIKEVELTF